MRDMKKLLVIVGAILGAATVQAQTVVSYTTTEGQV